MNTITSKQLYDLITSEKMDVTLITSRYFNMIDMVDIIEKEDFMTDIEKSTRAGRFDIIEWKCKSNKQDTDGYSRLFHGRRIIETSRS